MNTRDDPADLATLRQELQGIRQETEVLWLRLRQCEDRIERLGSVAQAPSAAPASPAPGPVLPPPLPLVMPAESQADLLPPLLARGEPGRMVAAEAASGLAAGPGPGGAGVSVMGAGSEAPEASSFEMRLGSYWLVRLGIVMVLTAMVFFGKYAYQHFIVHLGAAGKVLLLYLVSGGLLGLGAWLERGRESLRNYGQVLFGGGLAGVYFTTYAAHHLPHIQIIVSPVLDGLLLLGWSGFMVWLADRRKSELLSLFAIGLAFYASAMTRVGQFTLYSNLVLTLAAVVFVLRNRWTSLSLASLVATYAGYAFWRFYSGSEWRWAGPEEGLWAGALFLACYWALFTTVAFLARPESLRGPQRVAFFTLNNVMFFALFLATMLQARQEGFWKFSLAYGAVLLVLTPVARRLVPDQALLREGCLIQGLLLVTLGLIAHYSGPQLGLLLAAEAVVLRTVGDRLTDPYLRMSSLTAAVLSTAATIPALRAEDLAGGWQAAGVGLFLAFNAWWSSGRLRAAPGSGLRLAPAIYGGLALLVWLCGTWVHVAEEWQPAALAVQALVLTWMVHPLRTRELALLAQGDLLVAQVIWWLSAADQPTSVHPWSALVLLMVNLALMHWWPRQRAMAIDRVVVRYLEGLYALALVSVLYLWAKPHLQDATWMAVLGPAAIGLACYAVATRAWLLTGAAQILTAAAAVAFTRQLLAGHPPAAMALVPIVSLVALSGAAHGWFLHPEHASLTARDGVLRMAQIYRWIAVVMSVAWIHEYVPAREWVWSFAAVGALAFGVGLVRRNLECCVAGAAWTSVALVTFWLPPEEGTSAVYWPNLVAILGLGIQQQLARRQPSPLTVPADWHAGLIIATGVSLWRWLTCWVEPHAEGFFLTAAWAGCALFLFVAGLTLGERVYRWVGLGVLAVALGRVVLIDVWKLEVLFRTLSFLALGVVLLALGFLYNRFPERIRQWVKDSLVSGSGGSMKKE